MPPIRTFIAVEIDGGIRSRAAALVSRLSTASGRHARWVHAKDLHITLCFLGDVDMLQLPAVCRAAELAAERHEPFEVELAGAGAFPDAARPRTVWVGAQVGKDELIALQRDLEQELVKLGFPPEGRRFRPHLTLGRVKQAGQDSDLPAALHKETATRLGGLSVSEITIFSSRLDRDGPEYEALGHAELGVSRTSK